MRYYDLYWQGVDGKTKHALRRGSSLVEMKTKAKKEHKTSPWIQVFVNYNPHPRYPGQKHKVRK